MATAYIGIDLGTTNTTCGVAELSADGSIEYRQLPIPQPQFDGVSGDVYWNRADILPSAVWLNGEDYIYTGSFCVENADLISEHAGWRVVHGIKSDLGNRHWTLQHNGQTFTPAEISSCLLRTVWAYVQAQVRIEIKGIVITIPSSFSATMRRETLHAALMAGLPTEKVSLLDEPIAALFSAYGDGSSPFPGIATDKPIMVFDMGGGTVDVTVLSVRPDERLVNVHATSRYNQVAGDDFDLEIAAYLWRRLKDATGSQVTLSRSSALALLRAGEAVKMEINKAVEDIRNGNAQELRNELARRNATLQVSLDLQLGVSEAPVLSVPIADLLDLLLPFISLGERDRNYGRNIFTPIEQALDRAGMRSDTMEQVYLVGGGANFQPVCLELESYFHRSLSRALNPSYSVSAGAARFAALAANLGWRVSEATSERIYVRRSGEAFLEVLPDKLEIPSKPTVPPRALKGNDTIELPEDSRSLRLEFFQGMQENDPQMSPVYPATLYFTRPLIAGSRVHSIFGSIDENKIYQFDIGLTEPDGRKVFGTVEFSVDSNEPAAGSADGPRYHLNNMVHLRQLLQDDLFRSRLVARTTTARVNFPAQTAASVETKTAAAEDSLLSERNALLLAMNEAWADAYIGDKYLPTRMRATLAQLQDLKITAGVEPETLPHRELANLYTQYGATVIRSLLDHSFLVYGTHDLEQKLGLVVDTLTDDLRSNPNRVQILLADLDHHAASPFDVARNLVEIFLKAASDVPGIHDLILENATYSTPFKLMAARLLGEPRDAPAHLLLLLKQQIALGLGSDEFNWKVRPIISALAATGPDGFDLALAAFNRKELGPASPLVLGSFGDSFFAWAEQQQKLPSRFVPALFQALDRISGRQHRDDLIRLLLDRWSIDPDVKRRATEGFNKLPRRKLTALLGILSARTRTMVETFIRDAPKRNKDLSRRVRTAAVAGDRRYFQTARRDEQLSDAVAEVFAGEIDDSASVFLIGVFTDANNHFLRLLLRKLLKRRLFERLSESRQRLILESPITQRLASNEMLEQIKDSCNANMRPLVLRMIEKNFRNATK